jgi:hypothetical protein
VGIDAVLLLKAGAPNAQHVVVAATGQLQVKEAKQMD